MIEKTTKSGSPVGIALVGAFATIAGIGEIVVGLTGNYLGILAHPAGAPLILALCRSNRTDFGLLYLLVLGSDGAEDDGAALRPLSHLRRRFGTIKQTQVK